LFTQRPERIEYNVMRIVEHFRTDGLTRESYLRSALSLPALFCSRPATIIGHVERIAELLSAGLIQLPPPASGPDSAVARVLSICRETASIYVLSDDSIELRARYARTGKAPRSAALLKLPRHVVEKALAEQEKGPAG
jgi:hypothetical protein